MDVRVEWIHVIGSFLASGALALLLRGLRRRDRRLEGLERKVARHDQEISRLEERTKRL